MQVRNKHLTVAVSQFSYREGGGRGSEWLSGLNCVVPRICSCSSQLKRLTNTLHSFPNAVVICAGLRCEATHSSVYGCDSVGQRWVGVSSWMQRVDCLLVAAVAIYYATTFNTKNKVKWSDLIVRIAYQSRGELCSVWKERRCYKTTFPWITSSSPPLLSHSPSHSSKSLSSQLCLNAANAKGHCKRMFGRERRQ